jgi:16S rRNA (guanine527-N7)-methyltransferase
MVVVSQTVDKTPEQRLRDGIERLGLAVPAGVEASLWAFATTLLKWNEKVNLTAITKVDEVVEKHLLDSLAVLPEIAGRTVLDLGAGAGLPGIVLALARPELEMTLVDTVGKKVAFMKNAVATLGLAGRVRPIHARAEGSPAKEKLPQCELLVSRAFMDVGPWLLLARHYVSAGGRVVAMLGQTPSEADLAAHAHAAGLSLVSRRVYQLPFSGDPRGVAVFAAPG